MRINRLVPLVLMAFAFSLDAQTITWDGGGDGLWWTNRFNWEGDVVPGPTNAVVIPGSATVWASGNHTVWSLACDGAFIITNGAFTVTNGTSVVNGALTIAAGASLNASRSNTVFTANGAINATNSDIFVSSGARVTLAGLTEHHGNSAGFNTRTWQASGSNSVLDLPGLTNLLGFTAGFADYRLHALAGGKILASNLARVSAGGISVLADGTNSAVDFSALNSHLGVNSTFEARNGGAVLIPALTVADGATARLGRNGTMDTTQIASITNGGVFADNAFLDLPNLTNLLGSSITLQNGGTVNLSNVVNIDGASIVVRNGVTLALPSVTRYAHNGASFSTHNLDVHGAGSVLDLSAITNLIGAVAGFSGVNFRSYTGGRIELPGVVTVVPSRIGVLAEGSGSVVNLSNLVTTPRSASTFEARTGGTVNIAALTDASDIEITVRNTGLIPTAQIHSLSNSTFRAENAAPNLGGVTNCDWANLFALGTGQLVFPNLRSYSAALPAFQSRTLRADGAGSLIDFSTVTNFVGTVNSFSTLSVQAWDGGTILLNNITTIPFSRVNFDANGAGALIDLGALTATAVTDSTLQAINGGTINIPLLTDPSGFTVVIGNGSTLPTAQFTRITGGGVTATGTNIALPGVREITFSTITVNAGGSLTIPNVTNINGSSVFANGGATVSFPAVSSYRNAREAFTSLEFRATGAGSTIDFPVLAFFQGGTNAFNTHFLRAWSGGRIVMNSLTNIPASNYEFNADGSNSLNSVAGVAGLAGGGASIDALNGGTNRFTTNTLAVTNVTINLRTNSTLAVGGLALFGSSILQGSGVVPGAVWNAANVRPGASAGAMTVSNFTQATNGILQTEIGGATATNGFDVLNVLGTATLEGQLDVVRINNYAPPVGSIYRIVNAGARSGEFSRFTGLNAGASTEFAPGYDATGAFLTATFSAGPVATNAFPAGVISGALSYFDITFNEAIAANSLQTNDAAITGPAGPVPVTSVHLLAGRRVRFNFATQSTPGNYTIIVGPNITDSVGNLMNQDGDPTNGEAVEDRYTHSVALSIADLAVSNVNAPANATPGQTIAVSYTLQNVGAEPVVNSHVDAVWLSSDAVLGNDTLVGFSTLAQTLATGAVVTVTQTVTVPIFGPAGSLQVIVQADYNNRIDESSEANNVALSPATLFVPHTLQLQLATNRVEETGSAIPALISRNGDVTAELTVNLTLGDPTELAGPLSVIIPAGQNSVSASLTPVHDNVADGAQVVPVMASSGGFVSASNSVTVLDVDTPRLTLSASTNALPEGTALSITVTREVTDNTTLVVALSSSSPGQLSVPATVTIASNAATASFMITAVEDSLVESPHGYAITASASNHVSTDSVFTVHDNDVPALSWSLGGSVTEGGALSATLTRSSPGATALDIDLDSSLPARLNAPSSVTIPPGQPSVTFTLSAVENSAIDGNAAVTVTAYPLETQSGDRLPGTQAALVVNDNDGPTLLVSISRDVVAEGQTASVTVTRNTPATNDLIVSLFSDDTSEATVPPSVTITNGQASTTFIITALDDGVADGSVPVTITASAAAFASGADLVLVTDVNLPDLVITSLTVPTNGLTGDNFNISFREMNLGFANATGTWAQVVYLSDDPYPGDDEALTSFTFAGDVPPGLFVERSTQLRAPLAPGDYWIIVRSDTSNSVTELVEDNNSAVAAIPLRINPSFTATVQTAIDSALADTPIPMTGTATRAGGGAAQFELVSIHIRVKGTKRVIAAVTDSTGNFSATFTPLPGEGGSYTIGAAHPGVTDAPVQDAFTLLGMRFDPATLNTQVVALASSTNVVNLINLADVPLTGLSASLLNVHPALGVSATVAGTLPASGVLPVSVEISSLLDAPLTNVFTVRVTSAQGAIADLRVTNKVVQLLPRLVAAPALLEAGMRRGQQTIVPFTVMNQGGAESGPLTVQLPNQSFLHLSSPPVIDSIPAGGSNTVTLQLLAATNQPLGVYSGSIVVSGTNSSVSVPYSFRSLSDSLGSLQVEVVDELTYYAAGSPRVTNASVIVRDSISGVVVTNGLTGSNGLFNAESLPEGYYDLEVTADQHSTYRATILTPPGANTNLVAFISRQVVRYVWTVVPTEIEDRTRISIETVFETFVPLPVITVEPALIDLADYTNEVTQIDLKIQNHGLIAAQNMGIHFGSHPDWSFTPLITQVGTLNAQSSITVPLTIRRLTPFTGSLAKSYGACGVGGSVNWTLQCGNGNNSYGAGITINNAGGGGGCGGFGSGGEPGGSGGFGHPISYSSTTDCNPCDGDITGAVAECIIGFTPLGLPFDLAKNSYECYEGISGNGWAGVPSCLGGFAVTAAEEALGLTPLGLPYDILKCIYEIIDAACGGTGGSASSIAKDGTAISVPRYDLTQLGIHVQRLEDVLAPQVYLFGSENWFSMEGASPSMMSNLFLNFSTAIATNGEAGARISATERAAMNALPRPLHISALDVTRLMDRWNRTLDYADLGIYASTNLPFGSDVDFIAADILLQKLSVANAVAIVNEAEGYPLLTDGIQAALTDLQAQLGDAAAKALAQRQSQAKAGGGICAQVRLRIDQEAVITRDAFKATLELINASSSALQDVSISLVVRRGDGTDATSLFGIGAPALANLSDANGTGVVIPGTTGSATWTIIPTSDAAPTADTVIYFVSGTLRYQQDGIAVTVPLAPAAINVLPNPNLRLKYFHERDVLADDPFTTNVVEPSQPYSLAVLVQNTGHGTARNMRISSSQPQIIENEKGLLIDFDIIATEVAGQSISPALTVNFGDIEPDDVTIGRWLLKSTLQGQFVEYSATFEHLDGLGDPRLSLIESVEIHELLRVVKATNTLNDALPDFLVNDFPDEHFLPDTLHLSDATTTPVTAVTSFLTAGTPTSSNLTVQLQAALPGGWSYLRIPDPSGGQFKLLRVVRSDGTELPVENFWVTDRTFIAGGQRPLYETNFHLLDFNSTGNYLLTYETPPAPDTMAPSSFVAALPAESYANIPLAWSGSDEFNGSGLTVFDVYVSDNGAPFSLWLANTSLRGAVFGGISGHNYAFYTRARDAAGNIEPAPLAADAVTTVSRTNSAPALVVGGDQNVNEGAIVTILNPATDVDPDTLSYSLTGPSPSGVTINSAGTITWLTGEGNGPSTNVITIVVTDNGVPPLSTTGSVMVVVHEVNSPPNITTITNRTINEHELLAIQVFASDPDVPGNTLALSLANPLPGMTMGANGLLTWTPSATQGPSTNSISVIATDDGLPPLSATQTFNIVVRNTEGDFRLSMGSTNVLAGSNSAVPILLGSSLDITNISVLLDTPQSRLTGLVLAPAAPALASSVLSPNGTNRSELRFTTAPGQVLDSDQMLASLAFTASGSNSAIVPLQLSSLSARRSTGLELTDGKAYSGQVIIIGDRPVLTLERPDVLTVYGRPFHTYDVLWSELIDDWGAEGRPGDYVVNLGSNTFQRVIAPMTNVPPRFFRARQAVGP